MFLAAQEVLKIIADNLKKAGWSLGWVSALRGANDLDCRCHIATNGKREHA